MASPKGITAGVSGFTEAIMNRFILADGTKIQVKVWYATVIYSGGVLIVDPDSDSCGLEDGDLSYDTGSDTLEITVSGFTNAPHVMVERTSPLTNYIPVVNARSNTQVDVIFVDAADLTTQVTPGAIDANMNFTVFIIGY